MNIKILGCGPSTGVPVFGCACEVCNNILPVNIRTRSSVLISTERTCIVIDTGADFRQQMLKLAFRPIDAALYTHIHSDHCLGIDDLRAYSLSGKKPIDIYGTKEDIVDLRQRFGFLFHYPKALNIPWLHLNGHIININEYFSIGDLTILPFSQQHGRNISTGFILTSANATMAYSTDFSKIDQEMLNCLKNSNLDLWITGYIGYEGNIAHGSPDYVMSIIDYVSPKSAVLTHMSHAVDYYAISQTLPSNIKTAFDGMVIKI